MKLGPATAGPPPGRGESSSGRPRSAWAETVERDPAHSHRYVERFRRMAAQGADLVGEARLVDALAPRGAAVLDAGCGPGRHAGHLHRAGHRVVGVDLDPVLVAAAEADEPGPRYLVGDLVDVDLDERFDLVLCAGNVLAFLHPRTRRPVLRRFAAWLADDGRALVGFGSGRGYDVAAFEADAAASGLRLQQRWATWDLRPWTPDASFLVALLSRGDPQAGVLR